MRFETFVVGTFQSNTYVVYDENTLEALIIDPGAMSKTMINFLENNSLKPIGIILTHYHFDHVGAANMVKKEYDCPVFIHKNDEAGLIELANQGFKLFNRKVNIDLGKLLNGGDIISVGEVKLKVVLTPGHTPGSICLEVIGEKVVFSGDTIFANGIGRTDFKDGDELKICKSLIETVNKWPDDVTIYPGHGKSATMAEVRAFNGLFRSIVAHFQK
ncbi:MAG: MBL fold metallo-hydrolase [Halanaerobiales bacterium]|nr:MBL fold metallo-hydrolase [Halanaerobiales bacterium]